MSDTPRTDAVVDTHGNQRMLPNDRNACGWSSLDTNAFIDWGKQLERENNQLRTKLVIAETTNDEILPLIKSNEQLREGLRVCKEALEESDKHLQGRGVGFLMPVRKRNAAALDHPAVKGLKPS